MTTISPRSSKTTENSEGGGRTPHSRLGFTVSVERAIKTSSWICRRHDPDIARDIKRLSREGYKMKSLGDLISEGLVEDFGSEDKVEKGDYLVNSSEDSMPFIRTSDIANLEIVASNAERVPLSGECNYQTGDILFVKDGDKLVGETAIVLDSDLPFALQSHFRVFRTQDLEALPPHLLLVLMNSEMVRKQVRSLIVIQSTLGTIGSRYRELQLPMPSSRKQQLETASQAADNLKRRRDALQQLRTLS